MPLLERPGGRRVGWAEFGAPGGQPVLVLTAGMTRGTGWQPLAGALGPGWHVAAVDLPGHGETDMPANGPQETAMADGIAVADRVFGAGPVAVVGHSFGGTVALRLALEHGHRVSRLVLFEPVQFTAAHDAGDPAFAGHLNDWAPIRAMVEAGDMAAATDAFLRHWGGGALADLPAPRQARRILQMGLILAAEHDIAEAETPGRRRLADFSQIAMPVCLVRGSAARPIIPAIHRALLSVLPTASEAVIEGAGHMAPLTHPNAAADLIAQR